MTPAVDGWQKHLGSAASAAGERRLRDRLPARPDDLRRPLRQQRLAAGAAQADHQAHLGQRGHHEPGDGRSSSASAWAATPTAASTAAITCRSSSCELGGRTVRAPVWIMPGHADGAVTVYLGYGREHAGRVGGTRDQHGRLQRLPAAHVGPARGSPPGLTVAQTGERTLVACTQQHHLMENRDVGPRRPRWTSIAQNPRLRRASETRSDEHDETQRGAHEPLTLYEPYDYEPPKHKWGMVDRPDRLHRLQRLRRRLPGGEQHPRRRQGAGRRRPRDALAARRPLHQRPGRRARRVPLPAGAVHALRERAVRVRLPGRGDGPQRRGAQRHDLQPLRRHALLLEQLPLQGAAVQLLRLRRLRHRRACGCSTTPT